MKPVVALDLDGTLAFADTSECIASRELLEALAQKFALAIVTGGPKDVTLKLLGDLDALDLFDQNFIITKELTVGWKVSGEPYQLLIERAKPAIVVASIGDTDSDEKGSAVAGIPCHRLHSDSNVSARREELIEVCNRLLTNS